LSVRFEHASDGLRTQDGNPLRGFEIAGKEGDFEAAEARIGGQSVVLSSSRIASPRKVRYAWQPYTDANLVNTAGLPCSTFQSQVTPER
jgi:sialate O-acetylesterase